MNHLIIFVTNDSIRLLRTSAHLLLDGKFKVCPEIFSQTYTIHVLIKHQIFPCVFAPLPRETGATYNRFSTEVLTSVNNIGNEPEDMLVDLELVASRRKYFV